ncbi:MAG: hypothetical protein AB1422_07525 [bacterium]
MPEDMLLKREFLRKIGEKWKKRIKFVQEEEMIFAYFEGLKKFYGIGKINPNIEKTKEVAERMLYEEAWEFFNSLWEEEEILGEEPKRNLREFRTMLERR